MFEALRGEGTALFGSGTEAFELSKFSPLHSRSSPVRALAAIPAFIPKGLSNSRDGISVRTVLSEQIFGAGHHPSSTTSTVCRPAPRCP